MRKLSTFILILFLCSVWLPIPQIEIVKADSTTIYIRADGSVEGTDKIQREGDVYSFTDSIFNQTIYVERSNIIIDGCGFTLEGTRKASGVYLPQRMKYVTIKNLTLTNCYYAINLDFFAENITITGNTITNNDFGIRIRRNSGNEIVGNNITNNGYGIQLLNRANYHILVDNNIVNNTWGIFVYISRYATLRNNFMNSNENSLVISGTGEQADLSTQLSYFIHDIDTSNTINGKPVYYWVNQKDRIVPSDAGYVGLINCTKITVQNLTLSNLYLGVLLVFSTNSVLRDNDIRNCSIGMRLWYAHNNTFIGNFLSGNELGILNTGGLSINIIGNQILNADKGIELRCSNCSVLGNIIANNTYGLRLLGYSNNSIIKNNFMDNNYALSIHESHNNTFFHNNFINNTNQVLDAAMNQNIPFYFIPFSRNIWNNASEGNYWSDYNGTDNDGDGIGDTAYFLYEKNQDNYPLMTPVDIPVKLEITNWITSSLSIERGFDSGELTIEFTNGGNDFMYDVKVSVLDSAGLTIDPQTRDLGTINEGGTKTAVFSVQASKDKSPTDYQIILEVAYNDILGVTHKETYQTDVTVTSNFLKENSNMLLIVIAIIVILLTLVIIFIKRGKSNKDLTEQL